MPVLAQNRLVRSASLNCLACTAASERPKSRIRSAAPVIATTMATMPKSSGGQQPRQQDQRRGLNDEFHRLERKRDAAAPCGFVREIHRFSGTDRTVVLEVGPAEGARDDSRATGGYSDAVCAVTGSAAQHADCGASRSAGHSGRPCEQQRCA